MSLEAIASRIHQIVALQQQLASPATPAAATGTSAPSVSSSSGGLTPNFATSLVAAQGALATAPVTTNTAVGPSTNPVPGATGGRLDQGFDGTTKTFLSPFGGTVVYSTASDPGWAGGGYVAIRSAADPSKVFYAAEGLSPTVKVGDTVVPGQAIAQPVTNPYNGIVGNYEIGWANPNSPGQPLTQVSSDPKQVALDFYSWIQSLGGPAATTTSGAGHG
jgi:hypothetical protein